MTKEISDFLNDETFFLFGAEIEFYISSEQSLTLKSPQMEEFYQKLQSFAKNNNFIINGLDKEDGINQFEIQIQPNDYAEELADNIIKAKNEISKLVNANFLAKPFEGQPGSGMHFHISLYSEKTGNLFINQGILYNAIGGLLKDMPNDMVIFAPTENCLKRFIPNNCGKHIHYPTNYSWGFNNRTCAIRIPQSAISHPQNTRIEHRMASPIANPHKCLNAIVESITQGIINKTTPPKPIFGNAFDMQYSFIEKIAK